MNIKKISKNKTFMKDQSRKKKNHKPIPCPPFTIEKEQCHFENEKTKREKDTRCSKYSYFIVRRRKAEF